jgi:Flp pilus assembly protein TadD
VRLAAVDVLASLPTADRAPLLLPLLEDGIRSVRVAAARAIADVPDQALSPADRDRRNRGLDEWERVQQFNADTAGARVNLGAYYAERGDLARAKEQYEAARKLEPYFAPAAVNLADLYRAQGDDAAGERVLREAIARTPTVAALHHSLGLLLARRKDLPGAVAALKRAAQLAPDDVDIHYALGVALYSAGRRPEAIDELDRTWRKHPGDRTTLTGLISYVREHGDVARAESLAVSLVQISPDDPRAKALLDEIRRRR